MRHFDLPSMPSIQGAISFANSTRAPKTRRLSFGSKLCLAKCTEKSLNHHAVCVVLWLGTRVLTDEFYRNQRKATSWLCEEKEMWRKRSSSQMTDDKHHSARNFPSITSTVHEIDSHHSLAERPKLPLCSYRACYAPCLPICTRTHLVLCPTDS